MFEILKLLFATVAVTFSGLSSSANVLETVTPVPASSPHPVSISNTCYKPDGSSYMTTQDCETMEGFFNSPIPSNQPKIVSKDSSASIPSDPLVVCKGKYGTYNVRSSVCSSNTECADGYGKYIFESQESCKKRWEEISNKLKMQTDQMINSIQDQGRIQEELNTLQSQHLFDARLKSIEDTQFPDLVISPAPKPTFVFAPVPSPAPGGGRMYYKGY